VTGHFATILADPPWDVQQRGSFGAERHYPLMSLSSIKRLRVSDLARTDAHLWLWVTNAALPCAEQVIEAWGFQYRSCLTWIKPHYGLGRYLRTQTEHLLLATRGRAPIQFRSQGSWFYAPRQEHSRKPEEQYAIIERCSSGPYLELFARSARPGWTIWGDQAPDSDAEVAGVLRGGS
jgi:N6-adenosine-specific RNA methylase IME4